MTCSLKDNALPIISVIVPVYNTAKYLRRCLDSLINQSFTDIEIITINDGSTDNSQTILHEYALKDPRIRSFIKENEGVSQTRNLGISLSRGKYITFVDSDDWVSKDMLNNLYQCLIENQCDTVMCTYTREYADRSLPKLFDLPKLTLLHDQEIQTDFCRRLVGPIGPEIYYPELLHSFGSLCGKLYTGRILKEKNMRLVDLTIIGSGEDLFFNIQYFFHSKRLAIMNCPLYHYWKNSVGSLSSTYRKRLFEQWTSLFQMIREKLDSESLCNDFYIALKNRIALSVIDLGLNAMSSKETPLPSRVKDVKTVLTTPPVSTALKSLELSYLPFHWKLFLWCAKHKFTLLVCGLLKTIDILRKHV